jgi:hypothetical protein
MIDDRCNVCEFWKSYRRQCDCLAYSQLKREEGKADE